jgi:hypothetical protein
LHSELSNLLQPETKEFCPWLYFLFQKKWRSCENAQSAKKVVPSTITEKTLISFKVGVFPVKKGSDCNFYCV